ncbi:MAG: hypothetical protein SGPRY_014290, partial [Prymnesium sp.]
MDGTPRSHSHPTTQLCGKTSSLPSPPQDKVVLSKLIPLLRGLGDSVSLQVVNEQLVSRLAKRYEEKAAEKRQDPSSRMKEIAERRARKIRYTCRQLNFHRTRAQRAEAEGRSGGDGGVGAFAETGKMRVTEERGKLLDGEEGAVMGRMGETVEGEGGGGKIVGGGGGGGGGEEGGA